MKKVSLLLVLMFWSTSFIEAQRNKKMSREEYIEVYRDLAIEEMLRSGIPASITLAQGLLESDNGNSTLAVKGNNHFGIKCHNGWKGKKIHHDDDARNECFRKYRTAIDSYRDHTDFLMNTSRYAFLFDLEVTDYKGWAKGLKKAGYATSRQYADLLIRIIEENDLHRYDLAYEDGKSRSRERVVLAGQENAGRKIRERNRIDYVVVKEGDSFESLREDLQLLEYELYRYNDLSRSSGLQPGQVLYLQPKRNRAARGNDYHVVKEGETMWDISQEYGVKLGKLYDKNRMTPGTEPEPGQKIYLRKKKRDGLFSAPLNEPEEPEESEELEFEFDDF